MHVYKSVHEWVDWGRLNITFTAMAVVLIKVRPSTEVNKKKNIYKYTNGS